MINAAELYLFANHRFFGGFRKTVYPDMYRDYVDKSLTKKAWWKALSMNPVIVEQRKKNQKKSWKLYLHRDDVFINVKYIRRLNETML